MDSRAQTNAQLFLQIQQRGCSSAELRLVRDAYTLAMQLYTGMFTGSGKTTLAHEVGTASLAYRHGASFDLVASGLLHGAYLVGDWGHYRRHVTAKKRQAIQRVVGLRAEACVHGMTRLRWNLPSIAALADTADRLTELERNVVFLKLVEELDHLLDYGAILFFRNAEKAKATLQAQRTEVCRLATRLGHPALSAEIGQAIDLTLTTELPPELFGLQFPGDYAPIIIPRSCRRRRLLRLYQALSRRATRVSGRLRRRIRPKAVDGMESFCPADQQG